MISLAIFDFVGQILVVNYTASNLSKVIPSSNGMTLKIIPAMILLGCNFSLPNKTLPQIKHMFTFKSCLIKIIL